MKNLPSVPNEHVRERPGAILTRHDVAIGLLEENQEDQNSINQQLWNEIRALKEAYASDQRVWRIGWQAVKVVARWGLYVGFAAAAWAWNHWSKVEDLFHPPGSKSG